MDKGYEYADIHPLIRDNLHANSIIPVRSWNNVSIRGK
jgi:hypothetical protein